MHCFHPALRPLGAEYFRKFGGGGLFSSNMLNTDPPDHERLRRLVVSAFILRKAERPRIEDITAGLLDAMAAHDGMDLISAFAFLLPVTVIRGQPFWNPTSAAANWPFTWLYTARTGTRRCRAVVRLCPLCSICPLTAPPDRPPDRENVPFTRP